jgi:hypothetical protein
MWKTYAPKKAPGAEELMRDGLWKRFEEPAGAGRAAAEHFDHAAARLYVTAEDPPLLSSQAHRIRQWKRHRRYLDMRQVSAYEEQTLHYGLITFPTLTKEELGEHEIVNRKDLRLGSPQATVPPRSLNIHLCWGVGFAGYATSFTPSAPARAQVAYASILQGLTLLLLDDWRNALRLLRLRFFVHRARPRAAEVPKPFKSGRRWRNRDTDPVGLPPPEIVGHFFERAAAVALSSAGRWEVQHEKQTRRGWWCGCALGCDLPEFGFRETRQTGQTRGAPSTVWAAERSSLPEELSHLIVVDGPAGAGRIFRVHRSPGGRGYTRLQPERRYVIRDPSEDASFRSLRLAALDLVLDEVQTRFIDER